MPKGDNQPRKIDRQVLHELLFRRADRMGRLKLNIKALSAEIGCNYPVLDSIIGELVTEGRMRPMSRRAVKGPKTYLIADPAIWEAQRSG